MKLFEHADFEQAILRAAGHFRHRGLRPAIIEKDYYVTEALRILAVTAPDKIIFKGGTSLAKGWNLIQRFSEDIDIFPDPLTFRPPLGGNGINRELKWLRDALAAHPALTFIAEESATIGGFGRNDRFWYSQRFGGPGEVANRILVEAGTPVVVNRRPLSNSAHIWVSFLPKPKPLSVLTMKPHFQCVFCTFAGRSLRKCLRFTARWSCLSATGNRSAPTRAITMICFNSANARKCRSC